ncbi:MAG TPA: sigma-70 family RNA polymerase sigma factor [Iamia sp.]
MSLPPFDQVVAEHGAVVLRVCRAILGPHDADDAWSETFLSALRAYPDLRPDSDVRAWLVTIAHRKAIDVTRATTRRAIPDDRLPDLADRRQPSAVDADTDLWAALADLPPKQRQAVAYHHVAGLPHAEVAVLIGSSPTAVRKAASDGIARLRTTYPKDRTA